MLDSTPPFIDAWCSITMHISKILWSCREAEDIWNAKQAIFFVMTKMPCSLVRCIEIYSDGICSAEIRRRITESLVGSAFTFTRKSFCTNVERGLIIIGFVIALLSRFRLFTRLVIVECVFCRSSSLCPTWGQQMLSHCFWPFLPLLPNAGFSGWGFGSDMCSSHIYPHRERPAALIALLHTSIMSLIDIPYWSGIPDSNSDIYDSIDRDPKSMVKCFSSVASDRCLIFMIRKQIKFSANNLWSQANIICLGRNANTWTE